MHVSCFMAKKKNHILITEEQEMSGKANAVLSVVTCRNSTSCESSI